MMGVGLGGGFAVGGRGIAGGLVFTGGSIGGRAGPEAGSLAGVLAGVLAGGLMCSGAGVDAGGGVGFSGGFFVFCNSTGWVWQAAKSTEAGRTAINGARRFFMVVLWRVEGILARERARFVPLCYHLRL
jgi:hypothetical protein